MFTVVETAEIGRAGDVCLSVPTGSNRGDIPGDDDLWPNTKVDNRPAVAVWLSGNFLCTELSQTNRAG